MVDVFPFLPTPASRRRALDDALRTVVEIGRRLDDLSAASAPLPAETDWRAPSAREFGDRVDRWRRQLASTRARADDLQHSLSRAANEIDAALVVAQ